MSAKMETFFELKKVVDHDCGNYRIGEIDFVKYEAIEQYVREHGDFGEAEMNSVLIKCLGIVQRTAIECRTRLSEECMQATATANN